MKQIIVTGATSPVGSVIVESLKPTYNILAISRTTGWDLRCSKQHKILVNETKKAFAFINCAHISHLQGIFLSESAASLNISFGSLITKISWEDAKNLANYNYIQDKLFLEYVHKSKKNSALINISSFGRNEVVPNVTEDQLLNPIHDILKSKIELPTSLDIYNGTGSLDLSFQ
jgi:short-subunit dehydrogenase